MPTIGEISLGEDIGYKKSVRFIWSACDICKKERWVHYVKGKAEATKCVACCKIGKKIYRAKRPDITEKVGDIKLGYEIGCKCNDKYICEPCLNCGTLRWHQIDSRHKYKKCSKCINKGRIGELSGTWKGGIKINHSGYKLVILRPDSPYYEMANPAGYVFEHRLVAAQQLGRCLHDWEMVHHRDSNKRNNSPENLFVTDASNHNTLVEYVLKLQEVELKEQKIEIKDLKSRVTLLEAENTLFKMDMSDFI